MNMNMNKGSVKFFVTVAVLLVVLYLVYQATSGYRLSPGDVQTNISDSSFSGFFDRMTKLGPELRCNPGSADAVDPKTGAREVQSAYYTGGLLPGGYCDDQEVVSSAMNYKLIDADAVLGD